MATLQLGHLEEFQPEEDSIASYLERVELYFVANDTDSDKKVPVFLSAVGARTYSLLRDLLAPAKLKDQTFQTLADTLKDHFEPKKVVIAERFRFHRRNQAPGETVAQFVAELRRLATHCNFGGYLDEALRDRLVCGLRSETTQRRLLTTADLKLSDAIKIAQGLETAERDSAQLHANDTIAESVPGTVNRLRRGAPNSEATGRAPCWRCGKANHTPGNCRFKELTCFKCQRRGHIAARCRAKEQPTKKPGGRQQPLSTQYVQGENSGEDSVNDSDADMISVLKLRGGRRPITVAVRVNSQDLTMELDTGAAVSVISEKTFNRFLPTAKLHPTSPIYTEDLYWSTPSGCWAAERYRSYLWCMYSYSLLSL